jgi:inhibitor of KinA sporulation pathway (predicted exonuclease)
MAKLLDQILVVDLESTCWQGYPPAGQMREIIEVGLCPVDVQKLERLEKRSLLVKPVRSKISEFCTQLTTLTDEHVHAAGTLADAVGILKKEYRSPDRLWASWGDYDRRQFERVCKELTVPYPFGVSHLNIKTLFAVMHADAGEMGLDEACKRIGMPLEGTHHRGHDDAWNIAGILCYLLRRFRSGNA